MEGTHGHETGFGLGRAGGTASRRTTMAVTARPLYRLITALTLVALLVAGFAALPAAPAVAAGDYTTDEVNFRIGPGTDYGVMTIIPAGAPITVLGGPENGFYYIQYGDATGYASGDYLSVSGGSTPAPSNPVEMPISSDGATGAAWVFDGALNLRTEPGPSGTVILVMPDAAQVELTGEVANGYGGVIYNGTVGWASLDYLSQSAPTTPVTPVPTDPVTPSPTEPTSPGGPYTEDEIIQIIYDAADRYGQPRADMLRVAMCESNLDPSAVNGSSGASGLFQFMPSTFASTPYADQDIFDAWASANAAGWMWSVGRRNEWECQ
ncbi:MAG: SH3 domain-containing protein [Thermomicrobiales bacterium]